MSREARTSQGQESLQSEAMKKKSVIVSGRTVLVPRVSVQRLMDMIEQQYSERRRSLLCDLEDACAPADLRVQKLAELADQRGLMSHLVRHAFSMSGAVWIISEAHDGTFPEEFNEMSPDDLARIALHVIGFDPDDVTGSESAEGNQASESKQETG